MFDVLNMSAAEIACAMPGRSANAIHNKIQELRRTRLHLDAARPEGAKFTVEHPPKARRAPEQVIRDRAERHRQKGDRWLAKRDGLAVKLDDDGPYGVALFGDPHVDDDGVSMDRLAAHMDLVRSHPRLHAVNLGDITNNWVGKLGHLYGQQGTTEDEAYDLIGWLAESMPWVMWILGNHDKWGPVASIVAREKGILAVSHGCRLRFQCAETEFILDCRHDFPGRGQYNPAHGPLKMGFRGTPAHVSVAGHTHQSGLTVTKNGVTQHIHHALRVSSYKEYDEYADAKGFLDEAISPCVIVVVDPDSYGDEGFVTVFHKPEHGILFLNALAAREDEGNVE